MKTDKDIAIIGGGPAGLRAAQVAAEGGAKVTVFDAMPSVGRKFLVAGKSGLNLTHDEAFDSFLSRYRGTEFPVERWKKILSDFDNEALRQWALDLGIETFAASSGKVFPVAVDGTIKAAPLLRRWVERLRKLGVRFEMRHCWSGIDKEDRITFQHGPDIVTGTFDAIVLAMGGASWPDTGSTGTWTGILECHKVTVAPLVAANCGWEVDWPAAVLEESDGLPLKNLEVKAGGMSRRGELVITQYGLEGGPVYHLGPSLRTMESPEVVIDFKPELSVEELVARLGHPKRNYVREARRRWKLDPAAGSLLKHLPGRGPWRSAEQLAKEVKHCRIPLSGPRPVEEAISSAGGIAWSELTETLMLKKLPGVFACGEMIDWEAPTGGYLMQGCFATGDYAGRAALRWEEGRG